MNSHPKYVKFSPETGGNDGVHADKQAENDGFHADFY